MAAHQTDDPGPADAKRDDFLYEKPVIETISPHTSLNTPLDDDEDVHAGDVFPTAEEKATLRRVSDQIPWTAFVISFIELAERFSYFGTTVVFTNFIQQSLPPNSRTGAGGADGQSGALGLGQRASTGMTTFNAFWVYVTPLLGAYMADSHWGRYKTICVSTGIAMIGQVLLITSALPPVIAQSKVSLGVFVVAIIIMGTGTGGFKCNVNPLVAEQYRKTKLTVQETKKGEKVIVDPVLTTSRIYMYFYFFVNIGALIGQIGMTYAEKYVGFWLSFMLPLCVFLTCPIVLYLGRNKYVRSPPQGSVLSSSFRILRYCLRGKGSLNPAQFWRNVHKDGFWEPAKPTVADSTNGVNGRGKPRWMTYDDNWVEEVRRGFKACKVFVFFPIYWLTYNQMNNNLTSQAATMVTNGIPNDILSNFNPFSLLVLIPLCDFIVYPILRHFGVKLSPLRKITAGFFVSGMAMCWAAVVQYYIYMRNPCGHYAATCVDPVTGRRITSDLIVWIQAGSYFLIALSEVLAAITGLEYAFTKAPKNMRSLVMSVFLVMNAFASAIGFAFVSLSSDPLLVWNYSTMAVLSVVAGILFWVCFRHLDAEEDSLNELAEGKVNAQDEDDFPRSVMVDAGDGVNEKRDTGATNIVEVPV